MSYVMLLGGALLTLADQARPARGSEALPPAPPGRALLVGCTTYDHLEPALALVGPGNDVLLMRQLLCERFGFQESAVVVLSEGGGRSELRPTRANIEREFQQLQRESKTGQQVFIFLAGHGSQQPDLNPDPRDREPDGKDELFLPADVRGWDGTARSVAGAIVDDEIRDWLQGIERTGALVTIIIDSCNSGTMSRGVDERLREVPASRLIPKAMLDAVPAASSLPETEWELNPDASSSLAALYAAQSTEGTVEKLLPLEGADRKVHGLLTFTLAQVLTQSRQPLTYRQLVRQIQTRYAGMGRTVPTPVLEGPGSDREFLGVTRWPVPPSIVLRVQGRGGTINAGALHGLTEGCVLAVHGRAAAENRIVGHLRVTRARLADADVTPCAFEETALQSALPDGAICELVFQDVGSLRLRYAILAEEATDVPRAAQLRASVKQSSEATQSRPLATLVDEAASADWIVRVGSDVLTLLPAESAIAAGVPATGFVITSDAVSSLAPQLERIARAANLKRLAAIDGPDVGGEDQVHVELDLVDTRAIPTPRARPILAEGDVLTVRLKNPCRFPVDVTLLSLDATYGIVALFPEQGEINRLQPRDSISLRTRVTAPRPGIEYLLAIVTKGEGELVDFARLAQPGLSAGRTPGRNDVSGPLDELLSSAVFATPGPRGIRRPAVRPSRMQMLSWEVRPSSR